MWEGGGTGEGGAVPHAMSLLLGLAPARPPHPLPPPMPKGSCGFTNSDGSLPFRRDAVAAAADTNPDYPGSCNRCIAVRCRSGFVLGAPRRPRRPRRRRWGGGACRAATTPCPLRRTECR